MVFMLYFYFHVHIQFYLNQVVKQTNNVHIQLDHRVLILDVNFTTSAIATNGNLAYLIGGKYCSNGSKFNKVEIFDMDRPEEDSVLLSGIIKYSELMEHFSHFQPRRCHSFARHPNLSVLLPKETLRIIH